MDNDFNNNFYGQPLEDNHDSAHRKITIGLIIAVVIIGIILIMMNKNQTIEDLIKNRQQADNELQENNSNIGNEVFVISNMDSDNADDTAEESNETVNSRPQNNRGISEEEFAKLLEEHKKQQEIIGKNVDEYLENHRINTDEAANPAGGVPELYEYDCTRSLIAHDKGYGDPRGPNACPSGIARMEMEDHKASIYDAIEDCRNRGMRLPTYHELSAAGQYAQQLGLQGGNYWANSKSKDVYNLNCNMPRGNCGRFYSNPARTLKQWYRCVAME